VKNALYYYEILPSEKLEAMRIIIKAFHNKENGFTLIELLIVCIILGALAAAIVPNLTKFIGTSTEGAAGSELATIKNSITGYLVDHNGDLPCNIQPTAGNPQPLVLALIIEYLGNAPVLGGYIVDTDGSIVGDPAHVYPGLTWDAVNGKWVK
jgi:prepilin-type N-terminal cleavage/methylation domain-containing protein